VEILKSFATNRKTGLSSFKSPESTASLDAAINGKREGITEKAHIERASLAAEETLPGNIRKSIAGIKDIIAPLCVEVIGNSEEGIGMVASCGCILIALQGNATRILNSSFLILNYGSAVYKTIFINCFNLAYNFSGTERRMIQ